MSNEGKELLAYHHEKDPHSQPIISVFVPVYSSLPGLRPLLDVNYLPLTDMRIARTFCFTNNGQAMYLTSPTEIQRITYSQETCENLQVGGTFWKLYFKWDYL